jgi:hypothetical protein
LPNQRNRELLQVRLHEDYVNGGAVLIGALLIRRKVNAGGGGL